MLFCNRPMNSLILKKANLVILFSAALCSVILFAFAYSMYPVPDGDSIFFVPTIKSFASSRVLENKLVDLSYNTDLSKSGRFLFHTPGTPLIIGSLLSLFGNNSYVATLLMLSVVRCASVFIFAKAILLSLRFSATKVRLWHILISSALVFSNGLFLTASNGRPEILSMLIISTAVLSGIAIRSDPQRHFILQLCIALLFPVSIANGLIASLFYLVYLSFAFTSIAKRVYSIGSLILLSTLFFVLSYLLSGVSLRDGMSGLALHSSMVFSRSRTSGLGQLISYWKTWILFALMGCVRLSGLIKHQWCNITTTIKQRIWLASSVIALLYGVYYFGLRSGPSHYQLYAFLPLYQVLALGLVIDLQPQSKRYKQKLLRFVFTVAIGFSLLDPLRTILLYPYYLYSGSSYANMKANYEETASSLCAIMYTSAIAMLDEKQIGSEYRLGEAGEIQISERIKHDRNKYSCIRVFVQEVNSNSGSPSHMKLIADFSDKSPYTEILRSLKILNSPKGYSFRAYESEF